MPDVMQIVDTVRLMAHFMLCAISVSLIFVMLATPWRGRVNLFFSLFCAAQFSWGACYSADTLVCE